MNCADVFRGMPDKYREFGITSLYAVFQFRISGPDGGFWYADCRGDHVDVAEGIHPDPDVTISVSCQDVLKIIEGRMNPVWAFLRRKVRIKGDLKLMARVKSMLTGRF